MKKTVIFGASSAIAEAVARRRAARGDTLFLFGRSEQKLSAIAEDLRVRGATKVYFEACDLTATEQHSTLIDKAFHILNGLDIALICHGRLTPQNDAQHDFRIVESDFQINFISAASMLTHLANRFEHQGHGILAAISSVAGDRGRQSNYVYGSAKAALTEFLSGLRSRLAGRGVSVITVKPGIVDTPMTAHLEKSPLHASRDRVAIRIDKALDRPVDVLYAPSYWYWIMLAIRLLPERIFKRLRL